MGREGENGKERGARVVRGQMKGERARWVRREEGGQEGGDYGFLRMSFFLCLLITHPQCRLPIDRSSIYNQLYTVYIINNAARFMMTKHESNISTHSWL